MKLCSSITECSTHEKSSLPRAKRHPYDIPFPSLVGSNGDIRQAVLLTLLPRYPSSRFLSDIIGFAPHYSGGTVPAFHRSSLLSPQGTFLFIFGCHYSITLDSCCQIIFMTYDESSWFPNRQGPPIFLVSASERGFRGNGCLQGTDSSSFFNRYQRSSVCP